METPARIAGNPELVLARLELSVESHSGNEGGGDENGAIRLLSSSYC
jgi:hypothetical protein